LPADIPKTPQYVYAQKGWKGMSDWLGNGKIPKTGLEIGRNRTTV
jgi:hypothetical protein